MVQVLMQSLKKIASNSWPKTWSKVIVNEKYLLSPMCKSPKVRSQTSKFYLSHIR